MCGGVPVCLCARTVVWCRQPLALVRVQMSHVHAVLLSFDWQNYDSANVGTGIMPFVRAHHCASLLHAGFCCCLSTLLVLGYAQHVVVGLCCCRVSVQCESQLFAKIKNSQHKVLFYCKKSKFSAACPSQK